MASDYHKVYESWKKDPEGFWSEAAKAIDWVKPADKVFDPDTGVYGPLVRGRRMQHLLQLPRPARKRRTGRPGCTHL